MKVVIALLSKRVVFTGCNVASMKCNEIGEFFICITYKCCLIRRIVQSLKMVGNVNNRKKKESSIDNLILILKIFIYKTTNKKRQSKQKL